jgi:hypothetical protein
MTHAPRFGSGAAVGRREQVQKSNVSPLVRAQRKSDAAQDKRARTQAYTTLAGAGVAAAGGGYALAGGSRIRQTEGSFQRGLERNLNSAKQALESTPMNRNNKPNQFKTKAWKDADRHHAAAEQAHGEGLKNIMRSPGHVKGINAGKQMIRRGGIVGALGLAGLAAAVASGEHKRSEQMRVKRAAKPMTESQERRRVHGIDKPLPQWDEAGLPMRRKSRAEAKAHPNSLLARGHVSQGETSAAPVNTASWYVHGHESPEERKKRERRYLERMA